MADPNVTRLLQALADGIGTGGFTGSPTAATTTFSGMVMDADNMFDTALDLVP